MKLCRTCVVNVLVKLMQEMKMAQLRRIITFLQLLVINGKIRMTGSEIFAQGRIFALIGFSFSRPLAKIKYERERDRDVHMSKRNYISKKCTQF